MNEDVMPAHAHRLRARTASAVIVCVLSCGAYGVAQVYAASAAADAASCAASLDDVSGAAAVIEPVAGPFADSDMAALFRGSASAATASGTLKKTRLVLPDDGQAVPATPSAVWDAGALLDAADFRGRQIYTAASDDGATAGLPSRTTAFSWAALNDVQRAAFSRGPDGIDDELGPQRVDYVRGDRSLEIGEPDGVFRRRASIMGDINHSLPVVVGAPAAGAGSGVHDAFFEAYKMRAPAVYVGANDGMLHAFRASDGVELFAYIPAMLVPKLPLLTRSDYVRQPYVDGALAAKEAQVAGRRRTVLAGGMGRGAAGLFALDVSDPEHFTDGGRALFEFGEHEDADIAYQFGAPAIVAARNADGTLSDYLVVAGGYRHAAQASKRSALFLLSLARPAGQPWAAGVNYFKFALPDGAAPAASADTLDAGLSPPALVPGGDGALRYAYAGDLQGNLWRFDFSGTAPWPHATPARPIFVAMDEQGRRQPITQKVAVVFAAAAGAAAAGAAAAGAAAAGAAAADAAAAVTADVTADDAAGYGVAGATAGQAVAAGDGYLILFGTGKLLEADDASRANFSAQSFYGVIDEMHTPRARDRRDLQPRSLRPQGDGFAVAGPALRVGATGRNHGWYVDFHDAGSTGERSVSNALLFGTTVLFNTVLFNGDCTLAGRSYALTTLTGLSAAASDAGEKVKTTGMLSGISGAPLLLTIPSASVRPGTEQIRRAVILNRIADSVAVTPVSLDRIDLRYGRLRWREILNWQERRADALK